MDGETLFEGWSAVRRCAQDAVPSLVLLTSWRLVITDIKGGFTAVPISKIDSIEIRPPSALRLTTWYEVIKFDMGSADAVATLVNSLRQNPGCPAKVIAAPVMEISNDVCENRRIRVEACVS